MKIYLIAGESSGDVIGSLLMQALRKEMPGAVFYGIGGPRMIREGLHSLFPMEELSVMGLVEVLPKIRGLLRRIGGTVEHIRTLAPDIVITIDSPDFSFRVLKNLRVGGATPLCVHYVAPTVWAWRAGRAKKVARLYDGLLCLFPFEPPYFQKFDLPAGYVGHPVMEQGFATAGGKTLRQERKIPSGDIVLGLLPGSRQGEVERHGKILRAAAVLLQKGNPALHILVPTLPHIEDKVRAVLGELQNIHIFYDSNRKPEIFAAMDAAIAVSGTVGLELAVANVPHVIAYRMNGLTWALARRFVRARFAHLANILLNKEIIPEFLQKDCLPESIAAAVAPLLKDGGAVETQKAEFATVRKLLGGKTKDAPSVQAARFIRDLHTRKNGREFTPFAPQQGNKAG